MSTHWPPRAATYDDTGAFDFRETFAASSDDFKRLVAAAGTLPRIASQKLDMYFHVGARVPKRLVDMSARGGYSLTGSHPASRHQMASEYYQFDWEFGTTPEETSWLASSWVPIYG